MIHRSRSGENIFEKTDLKLEIFEISGKRRRERINGAKRQKRGAKQRAAGPAVTRWAAPPVTVEQSQQLEARFSKKDGEDADREKYRRF